MTTLSITDGLDTLNLNQVFELGYGIQALRGATGFGFPPVEAQYVEGAGDGSVYRSSRTLVRDLDIPLDIKGRTSVEMVDYVSRLARIMRRQFTLQARDVLGNDWTMPVARVGNSELSPSDVGQTDMQFVVTLRASDPYWTSETVHSLAVGEVIVPDPFLPSYMNLIVSSGSSFGTAQVDNEGDAQAYPIWTVYGPGTNLLLTSPTGETINWVDELEAGESLTIDTRAGTVIDNLGANRFDGLAPAPRFWPLSPGLSTVTVSLDDVDPGLGSLIVLSWRPRKWLVV